MTEALRALVLPLMVLAVLLQVDAVVKSAVMNLVGMAPAAAMPMDAMAMGAAPMAASHLCSPHKGARAPAPAQRATCGYCAAAAHAPLLAFAEPVRPSSAVAFAHFRNVEAHGPRGPPPVQPRARGPPRLA